MNNVHTTLSIESTCDDTSVAIVTYKDGYTHVHRMLTYSQLTHSKFGGVVPEYASRDHAKWLPIIIDHMQLTQQDEITYASLYTDEQLPEWVKEYLSDQTLSSQYNASPVNKIALDSISIASHPGLPGSLVLRCNGSLFSLISVQAPCTRSKSYHGTCSFYTARSFE